MKDIAARNCSNSSLQHSAGEAMRSDRMICSSQPTTHYAVWPASVAGAHVIYALAFMAAQNRVKQLQRIVQCEPGTNWAEMN